jgi:hypothetical protein
MQFLSQAFLWALPLMALPVLIHFFSRKQRDIVRWAAMEFLLASNAPRRRFLKLKDLLLLLLRILIVLLLVAALARPIVSIGLIGSSGPRDVVLVLDNSMSAARKLSSGTVFDQELDQAAKLIRQLSAADLVRVLLASPSPEWLTDSPQTADAGTREALISRLRQLAPNPGAADLPKAIHAAIKAEPAGKEATRFITVITDGLANGWRADATAEWASIRALSQRSRPPVILRAVLAGGDAGPVSNLAVEKLSAARAVAAVGQPVALTATVKNTGTLQAQAVPLAWSAGGQSIGLSTVPPLEPGAETTLTLSQPFPNPGLVDVSCQLTGHDDLSLDDSARFLLNVTESAPVLVVEGESHFDPLQSDSAYFLSALGWQPAGPAAAKTPSLASIFRPKLINYQKLDAENLASYQCVVLANVPRLSDDTVQKLARFVNSGGGLWIALGDQTEIAAFNKQFFAGGAGLSPASLKQPVGDAFDREKFTAVSPPSAEHPATALLADTHHLDIDRLRIFRRHQLDTGNDNSISVLLRAEGGSPLVVEKIFGRGRVIIQAVPLNVSWSNLPLCQSFVVMVHEWLWYLTESALVRRNLQPGEPLQVSVPLDAGNGGATVDTPASGLAQLVGREEQGRLIFRYAKTLFPGEYRLKISGDALPPEQFQVNRDPDESDFTPLTPAQIAAVREAGGVGFGPEPFSQTRQERVVAPPRALAAWLLSGLLAFMVLEAAYAFWLDRQRRASGPGVPMAPAFHV